MSKMKYIAVFLLAGIVIATVAIFFRQGGEPSYHGHRLSWWVDMYGNSYPDQRNPEDVEALTVIGTNALPYLINWIRSADAKRAGSAAVAFSVLGTNATSAIPDLKAILANPTNGDACLESERALTQIGPEGFAAVLEVVAIPGLPQRGALMQGDALANYMSRPSMMPPGQADPNYKINSKRAAPVLLKCMEDNDSDVQHWALMLLSGSDPDSMVPALTNFLAGSPPPAIRKNATDALASHGQQARIAVPFLLSRCGDSDLEIRTEATNALMKIAPGVLK
jgi:hypothetical protein